MNFNEMLQQSREWDTKKVDYLVNASDVGFVGREISVPHSLVNARVLLAMQPTALRQACLKLGPPRVDYIQKCPAFLVEENLNYWLTQLPPDRQWFVREYSDAARAILSNRYMPIGITQVLEWTEELMGGDMGKFNLIRPHITPDALHLKVQTMSAERDDPNYGYGVYIREGETGNLTMGVTGFIQRISCANSIVFDSKEESLKVWHRQGTMVMAEVRTLFKIQLNKALRMAVEYREAIARAEEEEVDDFLSVVKGLSTKQGFSEEVQDEILMGSEGSHTRMGLVNGVSKAAQSIEDADEALKMETLAGAILVSEGSLFGNVIKQSELVEA